MDREILVALLVLAPFSAICLPLIRSVLFRNIYIGVVTLLLVVCSTLLAVAGTGEFTVHGGGGAPWGLLAEIVDFGILLYFGYLGIARKSPVVIGLAIAQIVPLGYLSLVQKAELSEKIGFTADPLAIMMVLIVCVVGSAIVLFAIPYMRDHELHFPDQPTRQPRFFTLLVLFLGAMNGLLLCDNLYIVYLFWEITTLCCVLLIGHDSTRIALTNSTRALWMNSIGGLAFIIAIYWFHQLDLGMSLKFITEHKSAVGVIMPVAFLCLAGATKAAQLPFQGWLLGAMVAPTPVSALLHSSTMVKAGVYLILRLAPIYTGTHLSSVVAMVGGFTFAATAMLAISQVDGKRVLAYSTISNLGLIVVCAGINSPIAYSVGMMLILFHAVSKALLFITTGVIESTIESRAIEDMSGLISYMPFTTVVAVTGILSMFLPPFGMFIAKWAALEAAARNPIVMVLIVLGSTFTIVFWTKWMGRMLGTRPTTKPALIEGMHLLYRIPLAVLAAAIIVISVSVTYIVHNVVIPAVCHVYSVDPSKLGPLGIGSASNSTMLIAILVVLAAAVIIPAIFVRKKQENAYSVYLCGEQTETEDSLTFISARDEPYEINVGFFYFEKLFGEKTHGIWLNVVASCLLITMIGVGLI
jgi:ech hydrogenase subunit A